ncbi:ferredoxin [Mycolicibacterium moriokaense]|uniref:Ferredoxin n=1 Tax=Mycolicibacterium moriokaense TaxID=39691 RepID=A0A318H6I8_9MYCO|nr:ferredoxin [Mycolicibacterium moriokaense]PXW99863.1 ferredoxin [Mycolicibacterium moriokaense]
MQVAVDWKRCEGHGVCAANAPDLFQLDDNGDLTVTYDGRDIPTAFRDSAEAAVAGCPVEALRFID